MSNYVSWEFSKSCQSIDEANDVSHKKLCPDKDANIIIQLLGSTVTEITKSQESR